MKKLILLIVLGCFSKTVCAQIRVTDLTEPELKGNVKEVIQYTFRTADSTNLDTSQYWQKNVKEFDEKGNEIEELWFQGDNLLSKFLFTNANDAKIEKDQFGADGRLDTKYIFNYNKDGQETEFDTESLGGGLVTPSTAKMYFKYDAKGNRIEQDQYMDGNCVVKESFKYDGNNQRTESDRLESYGSTTEKIVTKYHTVDNQTSEEAYRNGQLSKGRTTTYYNIDKNRNWHTMLVEATGMYAFKHVVKRYITYY
jgi:hypothetical protein